jgi:hypothetical protein
MTKEIVHQSQVSGAGIVSIAHSLPHCSHAWRSRLLRPPAEACGDRSSREVNSISSFMVRAAARASFSSYLTGTSALLMASRGASERTDTQLTPLVGRG